MINTICILLLGFGALQKKLKLRQAQHKIK